MKQVDKLRHIQAGVLNTIVALEKETQHGNSTEVTTKQVDDLREHNRWLNKRIKELEGRE